MKKFFVMLLCSISTVFATAQAPQWQWAKSGTDDGVHSSDEAVSVDSAGNVYTTSVFSGNVSVGTSTFSSSGTYNADDILLLKYNKTGSLLWAKHIGGSWNDACYSVKADRQGYVYIAGKFHDTVSFGTQTLFSKDSIASIFVIDPAQLSDGFIAKYAPNGNLVWVQQIGGKYFDAAYDLALDGNGHIFVTGVFGGWEDTPPIHGACTFDTITKNAPGDFSTFIAKYDTAGHVIWVKSAGSVKTCVANSIALDSLKNIYISGYFLNPYADFDAIRVYKANLSQGLGGDGFVAKYDSNGVALWARGIGGERSTGVAGIAVSKNGSVYVTGNMSSQQTKFANTIILNGYTDIFNCFIAKFGTAGNLEWANRGGFNSYDNSSGESVCLDKSSNLYVTGDFSNEVYYPDTLRSYGGRDAFVTKYDSAGNYVWATHGGGTGSDGGMSLAYGDAGEVVVSGYYSGNNGKFGSKTLPSSNGWDLFVAKLASSTGIGTLPYNAVSTSIYPNPSSGAFSLRWSGASFDKATITNTLGEAVATLPVQKSAHQLNVSQPTLTDGLYFIELQGAGGTASAGFTIRH